MAGLERLRRWSWEAAVGHIYILSRLVLVENVYIYFLLPYVDTPCDQSIDKYLSFLGVAGPVSVDDRHRNRIINTANSEKALETQTTAAPAPPQGAGLAKSAMGAAKSGKKIEAPPVCEILKVRMPDGTIKMIRRAINPPPAAATIASDKLADANIVTIGAPAAAAAAPAATKTGDAKVETQPKATTETKTAPASATKKSSTVTCTATPAKTELRASESKPTSTAAATAQTATKPTASRNNSSRVRFFNAFALRAATTVIPSIGELGEFRDGDQVVGDDLDDSDGFDDDYDSDTGNYGDGNDNVNGDHGGNDDSHGDYDNDNNKHDEHHDAITQHYDLGHNAAMAGAQGLAAGLNAPPPARAVNRDDISEKKALYSKLNGTKAQVQVKVVEAGDEKKEGEPKTRTLHKSFSKWSRVIIWFIMISFPILFIGEYFCGF